jgi:hypothetical protein
MKKTNIIILLRVAVIALTVLVAISCNKEEQILPNTTSVNSNMPNKRQTGPIEVGCVRAMTEWCEECHEYCNNAGQTCLPCVEVIASAPVYLMVENITNLTGQSGDDVATFFADATNFADLLPELENKNGETFLKLLLSGDYVIENVVVAANGNGVILFHRDTTASFAVATTPTSSQTYAIPFSVTDK